MAKIIPAKHKKKAARAPSAAAPSTSQQVAPSAPAAAGPLSTPAISRATTATGAGASSSKKTRTAKGSTAAAAASSSTPKTKQAATTTKTTSAGSAAQRKKSDVSAGSAASHGTPGRRTSTYLQRTLVAYGSLHNPQQNQHGVNLITIRKLINETGEELKKPHRIVTIMRHLEDAGLFERTMNNYRLSEASRARIAAAKKEVARDADDKVEHSDERVWLSLVKDIPPLPNATPDSGARSSRAQSSPAPAAPTGTSLLSRISLSGKRAASAEHEGSRGRKRSRVERDATAEDDEGEVDDGTIDLEESVDELKEEILRLRAENALLKKKQTMPLSTFSSTSSLSSAPDEDDVQDGMEPVPEDELMDNIDDLLKEDEKAAHPADDKLEDDEDVDNPFGAQGAEDVGFGGGNYIDDDDDHGGGMEYHPEAKAEASSSAAYALHVPPALAADDAADVASSSQAGFLPSSPSADVASRLRARVAAGQPLSAQPSQTSQQRTPSASPPAGGSKSAVIAPPGTGVDDEDRSHAEALATFAAKDDDELVAFGKAWKAKLSEQERLLSDKEAQIRELSAAGHMHAQLQASKDLLQEEATSLQLEKAALQASLASMQQTNADLQTEVANLRTVDASKTAELANLARQVAVLEANAETHTAHLLASEVNAQAAGEDGRQLRADVEALKGELLAARREAEDLREAAAAKDELPEAVIEKIIAPEDQVGALKAVRTTLQVGEEVNQLAVRNLTKELDGAKHEYNLLDLNRRALQGDLEAKKAECVARTAAEAVLREQIAKLRTSVEELKTERDGDLMTIETYSSTVKSLTDDLAAVRKVVQEREAALAASAAGIQQAARDLETSRAELKTLQDDLAQFRQEMARIQAAHDSYAAQIASLSEERDGLIVSRDAATISADAQSARARAAERSLSDALASQTQLKSAHDAARLEVDRLTAALSSAKLSAAALERDLADARRREEELKAATANVESYMHAINAGTGTAAVALPAGPSSTADVAAPATAGEVALASDV